MTEVKEKGGRDTYNVRLVLYVFPDTEDKTDEEREEDPKSQFVNLGIIHDEGRQVAMTGGIGFHCLQKITEEELEELLNDCDPIEAPPGSYTVQPDKPGKIVWVTGAPGMGKSTTAQILGRLHGYVYYEADCFGKMD